MGAFTAIPVNTWQKIQLNAGIFLADFNPSTGSIVETDKLGATTGGITFTATPTINDFGSDIDNCPKNTMELAVLDSYEVKMSGTFATCDTELAKRLVGTGTITEGTRTYSLTEDTEVDPLKTYYTRTGSGTEQSPYVYTPVASPVKSSLSTYYELTAATADKLTPSASLAESDFKTIWWVGDYSTGGTGGLMAIKMMNALSTGGFSVKTNDKAKGNFAFEFTGHYSIAAQTTVPFEVYIKPGV